MSLLVHLVLPEATLPYPVLNNAPIVILDRIQVQFKQQVMKLVYCAKADILLSIVDPHQVLPA